MPKGQKVREGTCRTDVPRTTISRLKQCLDTEDIPGLNHLFSDTIQPGSELVLNGEEALIINARPKLAAERGFAVDVDTFKRILSRVTCDGRQGWKNQLPSNDTVRTYRPRHEGIAYKNAEKKEAAKLPAECFGHLGRFSLLLHVLHSFVQAYYRIPEAFGPWMRPELIVQLED